MPITSEDRHHERQFELRQLKQQHVRLQSLYAASEARYRALLEKMRDLLASGDLDAARAHVASLLAAEAEQLRASEEEHNRRLSAFEEHNRSVASAVDALKNRGAV